MSLFDGVWRPGPQRPGPDAPIEELLLRDGTYTCLTCAPPYAVLADGEPHEVEGAEGFDTVAITVVDDRTVRRVAWQGGAMVVDATMVLSPFGQTQRETQRRFQPVQFEFAVTSARLGPAPSGAHALSGRWRPIERDLPNHEEDTRYGLVDGIFSMRDGFGRQFDAPLDGSQVPYVGDGRFTAVSLRQIDDLTIEETNWNGPDVVLTTRWRVEPDGRTIHVRFEYASGLVQEQDGARID
jgi:hypothetical protein